MSKFNGPLKPGPPHVHRTHERESSELSHSRSETLRTCAITKSELSLLTQACNVPSPKTKQATQRILLIKPHARQTDPRNHAPYLELDA